MKPERRTKLVEYWTCARGHKSHQTLESAAACIARYPRPAQAPSTKRPPEDVAEIVRLIDAGETRSSVGLRLGISGSRIAQIYRIEKRRAAKK